VPSDDDDWQYGHSTETDFIYVATPTLNAEALQSLPDDVGPGRTLLVCCGAFRLGADAIARRFRNLTVKKMPKMVLQECERCRDDYSLNVANLPASPPSARKENRVDAAAHSTLGRLPQPGWLDEADV